MHTTWVLHATSNIAQDTSTFASTKNVEIHAYFSICGSYTMLKTKSLYIGDVQLKWIAESVPWNINICC